MLLLVFTGSVAMAEEPVDAEAQYLLAIQYDTGLGVEQDYQAAAKWYRKAANQGNADAKTMLKELEDKGYL